MAHKNSGPPPAPDRSLTQMERYYLACLTAWIAQHEGEPPTLDELAVWIKKGRSTVYNVFVKLENRGVLARYQPDLDAGGKLRRFYPVAAKKAA